MAREPEGDRSEDEEAGGGPVKSFLEHLEDLRWVLIRCVSALVVSMCFCLYAADDIFWVLKGPLLLSGIGVELQWLTPVGGIMAMMKIALWGGITLALPFLLYFTAGYILPALTTKERKYFRLAFLVGGGLFLLGVMLCYHVVLGISLTGLDRINRWLGVDTVYWQADAYIAFVVMFMIGMGLSLEFPVVLLTLVRLGVIPHEWLVKGRKYFILINCAVCAFISPDGISTIFMVIPVLLLTEICILISAYWERQKRSAENNLMAPGREEMP